MSRLVVGSARRFGLLFRSSPPPYGITGVVSASYRTSAKDQPQSDLYVSLCLQRPATIAPELNWLERRLSEYLARVEVADSLHSDHEMRHFEDLARAERIASGVKLEEKDIEEAAKQTAMDFEEASSKEAQQYKRASRVTKADLTNNRQSIDRSLDKYLYLIQKQRNLSAPTDQWLLPEARYDPEQDDSLRSTAERILARLFPPTDDTTNQKFSVHVKFLGNAPFGCYGYRYPKDQRSEGGSNGAQVFFFKCLLDQNFASKQPALADQPHFGERILTPAGVQDFSWATHAELAQELPKLYWSKLGAIIYPDELINYEQLMKKRELKLTRLATRLQQYEKQLEQESNNKKEAVSA